MAERYGFLMLDPFPSSCYGIPRYLCTLAIQAIVLSLGMDRDRVRALSVLCSVFLVRDHIPFFT